MFCVLDVNCMKSLWNINSNTFHKKHNLYSGKYSNYDNCDNYDVTVLSNTIFYFFFFFAFSMQLMKWKKQNKNQKGFVFFKLRFKFKSVLLVC